MTMEQATEGLSRAELAERADATEAELERMVALGILVPRHGRGPFLPSDVQKVRLTRACERAGLPLEGIGRAIEQGRVSFAFLEAAAYRRWAQRSDRTYREACEEAGVPSTSSGASSRPSATPGCPRRTGSGRTSWRSFPWFGRPS